jgi:hypothetical protein
MDEEQLWTTAWWTARGFSHRPSPESQLLPGLPSITRYLAWIAGLVATSCYHRAVLTNRSVREPKDQLPATQGSSTPRLGRSEALTDLVLAVGVVLVSLPWASPSRSLFRHLSGLGAVLALAAYQFAAEGLVPLLLIAFRRERLSGYGFTSRSAGRSVALALTLAAAYDLALSGHAGAWLWVPLRRHTAVRMSLAAGFPLSFVGLAATIAAWGWLEAFFGVFFAKRVNQMLGHCGHGWLAPGALGFALFNGLLHMAIGQGIEGFLTSFASGYAIGVIPAITDNAWGSSVFQALTNSVGRL